MAKLDVLIIMGILIAGISLLAMAIGLITILCMVIRSAIEERRFRKLMGE